MSKAHATSHGIVVVHRVGVRIAGGVLEVVHQRRADCRSIQSAEIAPIQSALARPRPL